MWYLYGYQIVCWWKKRQIWARSYCVKCKEITENLNSKIFRTKNDRLIMQSNVMCVELKNQDSCKNKMKKIYWVI